MQRHRVSAIATWGVVMTGCVFCTGYACTGGSGVAFAPDDGDDDPWGDDGENEQPAPTGQRWVGVTASDACGRQRHTYVLGDEVCDGTLEPDYLNTFVAPMFRDGVKVDDVLYAVDGRFIWTLTETTDDAGETQWARDKMQSGVGHPIATDFAFDRVLVAAGEAGLIGLHAQGHEGVTKAFELALDGLALDVAHDDEYAYVAAGHGGLARVRITDGGPVLIEQISIGGYAAGVAVSDGFGYVAACGGLAIVDLDTNLEVGFATLAPEAFPDGDIETYGATAPFKDVAVLGNTAYVAAGRYGLVRVDVSDKTSPVVQGNCTQVTDLAYYASGVRAQDSSLFLAGGEWGVQVYSHEGTPAALSCADIVIPETAPDASVDENCEAAPPWEDNAWRELWDPPPPATDPVQVLPEPDGTFLAFGDARRLGIRAVDHYVKDAEPVGAYFPATRMSRYDEPRLVETLSADATTVATTGEARGIFAHDADTFVRTSGEVPADAENALVLHDERVAFLSATAVTMSDGDGAVFSTLSPERHLRGAVFDGEHIQISTRDRIIGIDVETAERTTLNYGAEAALPPALARTDDGLLAAAPEWTYSLRIVESSATERVHDVFDVNEVRDPARWAESPPLRVVAAGEGVDAEVVALGARSELIVRRAGEVLRTPLPKALYVGAEVVGEHVVLVSGDRRSYRSALLVVKIPGVDAEMPELTVVEHRVVTGVFVALATSGVDLLVGDANAGIRRYALDEDGALSDLGVLAGSDEVQP